MIDILSPEKKQEWLPALNSYLSENKDTLDVPADLIINQVINKQLFVFHVNKELYALGRCFWSGNKYIFFINHAYGKNIRQNLLEILDYSRKVLNCDRLEFLCGTDHHVRFYKTLFDTVKARVKKEHYFRITLEEDME